MLSLLGRVHPCSRLLQTFIDGQVDTVTVYLFFGPLQGKFVNPIDNSEQCQGDGRHARNLRFVALCQGDHKFGFEFHRVCVGSSHSSESTWISSPSSLPAAQLSWSNRVKSCHYEVDGGWQHDGGQTTSTTRQGLKAAQFISGDRVITCSGGLVCLECSG